MDFPLPWKHWSLQSAVFATTTTCRYIDVLLYPNHLTVVDEGGMTCNADVRGWMEKKLRRLGHTSPIGGLRLLYGGCRSEHTEKDDIVPLPYTHFRELSVRLGLPRQFEKCIALRSPQSSSFGNKNGLSQPLITFIFKMGLQAIGYFTIALSYNEDTHITHSIFLAQTVNSEFPRLLEGIKLGLQLCLHPLYLVIGLEEIIIDIAHEKLDLAKNNLDRLEALLGLHPFRNKFVGDQLKIDFVWATRTLNSISTMVSVTAMRIGAAQLVLEKWSRYNEQLHLPHMNENLSYSMRSCGRMRVYNYMSQKDALVNIEIATESKKDSSAVKAIAVLTMVFLPGTFIAAFFAMPLFDWGAAPGTSVLRDRFNYYWIITLPLTVGVMIVWGLFLCLPWRKWASSLGSSKHNRRSKRWEANGKNVEFGTDNAILLDDWANGTASYPDPPSKPVGR